MTHPKWEVAVTEAALAPGALRFSALAGGVVEFWGVVRGQEDAEEIAGIDYEAHTAMAQRQLELLARDTADRFPVLELVVQHRIGFVPAAEPSLYVRVSAVHRGPAFAAAEWLIDELKRRIPVWKHPAAIG